MINKEEGMEKWQQTRPEPATSRFIADYLAVEPWSLPASIDTGGRSMDGWFQVVVCFSRIETTRQPQAVSKMRCMLMI